MADDKLSRFKILEKSRDPASSSSSASQPAAAPAGRAPSPSGRFGALETSPGAAARTGADGPAPAGPSAVAGRFAGPEGPKPRTLEELRAACEAPSGLELAQVNPDDQPFVRCIGCEADNNAWATTCAHCGANLNTAAQRAFNERLWAQRKAEAQAQAEELERARQARADPAGSQSPGLALGGVATGLDPRSQREIAERMAAEVAQQARARMETDHLQDSLIGSLGGGFGSFGRHHGYGAHVFAHLYGRLSPQVRQILLVVALVAPAILAAIPATRPAGVVLFFVVIAVIVRIWLAS